MLLSIHLILVIINVRNAFVVEWGQEAECVENLISVRSLLLEAALMTLFILNI